jgi:Flp pilus assembly pilin Flp
MVRLRQRKGQSTVEYMLFISVISIALVALSWIGMGSSLVSGFNEISGDTRDVLQSATQTGTNDAR